MKQFLGLLVLREAVPPPKHFIKGSCHTAFNSFVVYIVIQRSQDRFGKGVEIAKGKCSNCTFSERERSYSEKPPG